jgi:hypothetical protein
MPFGRWPVGSVPLDRESRYTIVSGTAYEDYQVLTYG